jgi:hypothetical protein
LQVAEPNLDLSWRIIWLSEDYKRLKKEGFLTNWLICDQAYVYHF